MRADLEAELMRRVHDGELPRAVIGDLLERGVIASPKQGWRTLEKWERKGWFDCGVSLDTGWMTEKAPCGRSKPRDPGPWAATVVANGERHSVKIDGLTSYGQPLAKSPAEVLQDILRHVREGGAPLVDQGRLQDLRIQIRKV